MMTKDEFFVPENAVLDEREEHLSESGRFKLVVTPYCTSKATGKNTWNLTQGLVYRVGADEPIAEVRRNYHRLFHLFIEDHPLGHPLLVCGEDYQGQTVIELDTGRRRTVGRGDAGYGFCWASHRFHAATSILTVSGCYWACSYEHKFFDFADPLGVGWPEIDAQANVYGMGKWPEISADGVVRCFDVEESDDEDEDAEPVVKAVVEFRREGNKLVKLS